MRIFVIHSLGASEPKMVFNFVFRLEPIFDLMVLAPSTSLEKVVSPLADEILERSRTP